MPGSVTITNENINVLNQVQRKIVTVSWVGATSGGAVPAASIVADTYGLKGFFLYSVETNPGSTAPTDNYDIVINDADGLDIAGGLLVDRDTANTEIVNLRSSAAGYPMVRGDLSAVTTGNSVNSATGTIIMIFVA
jgi:hypothetical protein